MLPTPARTEIVPRRNCQTAIAVARFPPSAIWAPTGDIKAFIDLVLSAEGQEIVTKVVYFPIKWHLFADLRRPTINTRARSTYRSAP